MADYITIQGKSYRVQANWNAVVAFLEARGTEELSAVNMAKPTNWAPMMAACINEGERLDGRKTHFTAEDLGQLDDFTQVAPEFIQIYVRQSTPATKEDEGSKKE